MATVTFAREAHAEPMVTVDPTIGAGGSLTHGGVRGQFGIYGSLMFGPPAREDSWTFPVGVYAWAGGDTKSNGYASFGVTAAALGAPDSKMTPFILSLGFFGGSRDDDRDHYGTYTHLSWGIWGPDKWVYKGVSAQLFVEERTFFADHGRAGEAQVVAGVQLTPIAILAAVFVGAYAANR